MEQKGLRLITIPKITDLRGNLSFVEQHTHVPFEIKRAYWIYDVPGGQERGEHAFRKGCEVIVPLSGSFSIEVYRGEERFCYELKRPHEGLYLPPLSWRKLVDFSTNATCLVLSNTGYQPDDYVWNFQEYLQLYKQS